MTLLFLYLSLAIGVSFLCSVLEAVLLSITPSYAEALKQDKPRSGEIVEDVRTSIDKSLAAILILNTFAHTMGAAGVGSQAMQIFGPQWETLIAVVLTLVILYFSEIIPKTLGATFWKPLAGPACWTILVLVKLVYPLVWTATQITRVFSRKGKPEVTREEIIALATLGQKAGNLLDDESQYLANLLSLRELTIDAIQTPRSVVHMVASDMSVADALEASKELRFSRMPVYGEGVDDIDTIVLLKDLYEAFRQGRGSDPVASVAMPIDVVSEKLPLHRLLELFIKRRAKMCLVHDEFGQTTGIVTLEDVIETLLGREILDESDSVVDMQALARDQYRDKLRSKKNNSD